MATAARTRFSIMREIASPLSTIEQRVYEFCKAAASEGRELDNIGEMSDAIGLASTSTIPGAMKRLEEKGYITRKIYQRGRQVCITATGQCTPPPANTAPHWRDRVEQVPSPAIQKVAEKSKPIAAMIEAEARITGQSVAALLADLVYIGWLEYVAERECGG